MICLCMCWLPMFRFLLFYLLWIVIGFSFGLFPEFRFPFSLFECFRFLLICMWFSLGLCVFRFPFLLFWLFVSFGWFFNIVLICFSCFRFSVLGFRLLEFMFWVLPDLVFVNSFVFPLPTSALQFLYFGVVFGFSSDPIASFVCHFLDWFVCLYCFRITSDLLFVVSISFFVFFFL